MRLGRKQVKQPRAFGIPAVEINATDDSQVSKHGELEGSFSRSPAQMTLQKSSEIGSLAAHT
jgi:hypothetical protein